MSRQDYSVKLIIMAGSTYKDLVVWQKSVKFASDVIDLIDELNSNNKHYRLREQVESRACSVAANIAEGKGRKSNKEYVRFLYIARGSLFECLTFLNIFYLKNWIAKETLTSIENKADEIGRMLKGLINRLSET